MIWKAIRVCILVLIGLVAVWIGYWIYEISMELFAFQLTFYERMINSQQLIWAWQDQLAGVRNSALEFLWKEQQANNMPLEDVSKDLLSEQAKKLQKIAIWIWIGWGLLVRKIMFDIVFWCKKSIQDIKEFIH